MDSIKKELSKFYFILKDGVGEGVQTLVNLKLLAGEIIWDLNIIQDSLKNNNEDIISQDKFYDIINFISEIKDKNFDILKTNNGEFNLYYKEDIDFALLQISKNTGETLVIITFIYEEEVMIVRDHFNKNIFNKYHNFCD